MNRIGEIFVLLGMFFLLTGCGGSGDNSTSPSTPAPAPIAPSLSLTASSDHITSNTEVTLTWSSANADSCSASEGWSGEKATSGSESRTESEAGNKIYTLSCSGAGGETSKSVEVETINDDDSTLWDHTNIIYGADDPSRQWLNIHLAYDKTKPSPIYLFAHGNGGSANGMNEKELHEIAIEGYTVISWESIPTINNGEDLAIGLADVQIMFDWVRANADTYNLDPDYIVVGGRSRGSIISWQLAHSSHPSIKGIYMYNALPRGAWQDTDAWSPVDEVAVDSPTTYLVYGPDFDDDDGHNPMYVDPVVERYEELGIGDRMTRYVDMWGDFQDGNGNWTNDGKIMHYFSEFVAKLDGVDNTRVAGYNTLFMGHSFFAPIARQIPFHMTQLGIDGHSQHVESSPGETGKPLALWEDEGHRNKIQAILNTGQVNLLGMTASQTNEGYTLWIDYALSKNPNTKIVIGTPWLDFPADYSDAVSYENIIIDGLNSKVKIDIDALRVLYPDVEIISLPYAFAAIELRHMFETGQLPEVTELIGNDRRTSIFADQKGHGHGNGLLLDLAELIWISHIYDVNLDTYEYSAGHNFDLKEVANTILDRYAYYFD